MVKRCHVETRGAGERVLCVASLDWEQEPVGAVVVVRPQALRGRLFRQYSVYQRKTLTLYRPDLTSDRADSPIVPIATLPVRKKAFVESSWH